MTSWYFKGTRKPQGWDDVVGLGLRVLIEEVRLELEKHYDDVHLQQCRERHRVRVEAAESAAKKPRQRRDKNVSYVGGARGTLRSKFETFQLPLAVKNLLKHPRDETDWEKLETLKQIVRDECEGNGVKQTGGISWDDLCTSRSRVCETTNIIKVFSASACARQCVILSMCYRARRTAAHYARRVQWPCRYCPCCDP